MLVSFQPQALSCLAVCVTAACSSACVLDYPVGNNPTAGTTAEDSDGTSTTGDVDPTESDTDSCGDGVVDLDEACDDGNADPADGCDFECNRAPTLDWTRTDGGEIGGGIVAESVAIDPTGRIIVVGSDLTPGVFDNAAILAFDPGGEVLWRRTFPNTGLDWSTFSNVAIDTDGRIYAGGFAFVDHAFAVEVRCFDANGELLWTFHEPAPVPVTVRLHGLASGPDGLYSIGRESGPDDPSELVVRRHDPATGEATWKFNHKGPRDLAGTDIAVVGDHLIAVGRASDVDSELPHPLVDVLDLAGTLVASAEEPLAGEWVSAAPLGATGHVALAGYYREPGEEARRALLRRIDGAGAEVWTFAGEAAFEEFFDVAVGPDEAIVAVGSSRAHKDGDRYTYTRRFAGDGATVWSSRLLGIPGATDEQGHGVTFATDAVIAAGIWLEPIGVSDARLNLWLRRFAD